jgi:hypothetical protein
MRLFQDRRSRLGKCGESERPEKLAAIFPGNGRLAELLGLEDSSADEDVLLTALFDPLAELACARGKRIRGQLVELACRLVCEPGDRFLRANNAACVPISSN